MQEDKELYSSPQPELGFKKDKKPYQYSFSIYFIVQQLNLLMFRYPLTIPHILQKKLKTPQTIAQFKNDAYELPFADYIILIGGFMPADSFNQLFYCLNSFSYSFHEESAFKYLRSNEYYNRVFFDRILLWSKKILERKDAYEKDSNVIMLAYLQSLLKYLVEKKQTQLDLNRLQSVISFMFLLIKKAQSPEELERLTTF